MDESAYEIQLDYGVGQVLLKRYYKVVLKSLKSRGDNLISEFSQMPTDIQRVYYFLEIMSTSHNGHSLTDIIRKEWAKSVLESANGKSDDDSIGFLEQGVLSMRKNDKYMALYNFTKAVFNASSKEQLALSMLKRAEMLLSLRLFEQAKDDVERAIPILKNEGDILRGRMILGKCYKYLDKPNRASKELKRADKLLKQCEKSKEMEEIELEEGVSDDEFDAQHPFECHRPKLIKAKSPEKLIRFRNTGTERGWITEVTRDVPPLQILLTTKPVTLPLSNNLTKYCYVCQTRCHNLLPCKKCAHVGFCSKKCSEIASKNKRKGDFYPHRHKYDCNGVMSVISNCFNFEEPLREYRELFHAAFMCVANTSRHRLLEYICSVRKYKKTKGHPAFNRIEEVQKTNPPLWNKSDYASIAWMNPLSEKWNSVEGKYGTLLLDYTIAAVFLAFCLYLGGYPMDWDYSKQGNVEMHVLDKPSASWIAACLLYHLQSARLNSFGFFDVLRSDEVMKYEDLSSLIYPPLSLINHSCNPSALVHITSKGAAFLIPIRGLKAGSEITISYHVAYDEDSTEDRRRQLKEKYLFDCKCEACRNDWNDHNPTEKVKCRRCGLAYELFSRTLFCSKCKSALPKEEAHQLISDVRDLRDVMPYISWNTEHSQNLSSLLTRADSLLDHPSQTLIILRELIFDLLKKTAQMWTCEPWLGNYYECINDEESVTLKEVRQIILN